MTSPRLEIPIFGPASASAASELGASRLEVNAAGSYSLGGTTPSLAELREAVRTLAYPKNPATAPVAVRVMIRPRGPPSGGLPDFLYSRDEFAEMREAIVGFKESGALEQSRGDGFVFGLLRRVPEGDGEGGGTGLAVDVEKNTELVTLVRPFRCVFHRAFDDVIGGHDGETTTRLWEPALEHVIQCGFDGLLTSGGPGGASGNTPVLKYILQRTQGRIEVIVGGGVRGANIRDLGMSLDHRAPTSWFHSSCLTTNSGDNNTVDNAEISAIVRELERLKERVINST